MDNDFDWAMFVTLKIFAINPEALHRPKGVKAILAGEIIAKVAKAIGETCDNGGAVRNALVARHGEFGREIPYRSYMQ